MTESGVSPPGSHRLVFLVLALAMTAVTVPQALVIPVVPRIGEELGTDPTTAAWLVTAFLLSSSVATPLLGRIGDTWGHRRMLVATLTLLAVGCLAAALARDMEWLIAARVLQGAAGGIVPLTFAILRRSHPGHRLGHGVAVMATIGSVGFALGTVSAGPLVASVGRTWLFVVPLVVTITALVGTRWLPHDVARAGPARWFGPLPVLLFSAGLVLVLIAINRSVVHGWFSVPVLACSAGSLACLGAWLLVEQRADVQFVELAMLRRRGVWASNAVALLAGAALFGNATVLPQLLRLRPESGGIGASLTEVGWLMLPTAVTAFLASLVTGRLLGTISSRRLLVAGAGLSALSFIELALWHDAPAAIVLSCVLQGAGNGLLLSTLASVVMRSVPAGQTGAANGMNANVRSIGGSLGSAVVAALVGARLSANGAPTERGLVLAVAVLAALMVATALAALAVPSRSSAARPAQSRGGSSEVDDVASGARPWRISERRSRASASSRA